VSVVLHWWSEVAPAIAAGAKWTAEVQAKLAGKTP